jgi:hypothetical protein
MDANEFYRNKSGKSMDNWVIHHKNHNRADNRPENLELFENHKAHWMQEHYADVASARDAANSRKNSRGSQHP